MSVTSINSKVVTKQRNNDARLLDYANQNRLEGYFNDVIVKTENQTFQANRMVLSCFSKFFEKMFRVEMKEKYQNTVEVPAVDSSSMQIILEFIYTGQISFTDEGVVSLLSAADYLLIDEVKQYCFEFLADTTSKDNCFDTLKLANLYQSHVLKQAVFKLLELDDNFATIMQTETFQCLSKCDLMFCLSNLDRNIVPETYIFESIISWTNCDGKRKKNFPEIFRCLKLDLLPFEFLVNTVYQDELVEDNHECSRLVKTEFTKQFALNQQKLAGSKIICLGSDNVLSKVVEIYSYFDEKPIKFPDVPMQFSQSCALNLDKVIYLMGGLHESDRDIEITSRVWKLDLKEQNMQWEETASLCFKRHAFGATIYQSTIVLSGGHDGGSSLSSTEVYNKVFEEWTVIKPMNSRRYGHALVACSEQLFAIGGMLEGQTLSTVEQLSHLKQAWKNSGSLQTPRAYLAAICFDDKVYVIGGQNEKTKLKSVEKFDFLKRKSEFASDMHSARSSHSACLLQNKIYVAGGFDGEGEVVKTIECYDPSTDKWTVVSSTEMALSNHSLVVI